MLLLTLLVGWVSNVSACAIEETYNYMALLMGSNEMNLKMPLYDKEGIDCWVVSGSVYIKIDGASNAEEETLFYYQAEQNIGSDDYAPYIYCYKGVEGTMVMNRARNYSQVTVNSQLSRYICPCVENKEYAIVDLKWTIPDKYRGKRVRIRWNIHHDGNTVAESDKYIDVPESDISIPSTPTLIEPVVMDPMIAFEAGRPNRIMLPYMMAANKITEIIAFYYDLDKTPSFIPTSKELDITKNSDFVYLPADKRISNFAIRATYEDDEGNTRTTASTAIDLPMLHHAKNLSASLQDNGRVMVKWYVDYPEWKDISDYDNWEIQRNLSGSPSNDQWSTVGQVAFEEKAESYSFEDESFLNSYEGKPVYYRVRRAVTAVWNWGEDSGYALTMLPQMPALPAVVGGTVSRSGEWTESSHSVTVQFQTGWPERDAMGRYILRSAHDWKQLARIVNEGLAEGPYDAVMLNDIDLGTEPLIRVGNEDKYYTGTFDGMGHTLTFNPPALSERYAAPFGRVNEATIRNLHTQGAITSSQRYASGLVGRMMDDVTVENCISSVHLKSTMNNNANIGGFVGLQDYDRSCVLKNCLFDGSIEGENCYENGGLGGYCDYVFVNNCLFAPSKLNTKTDGCETFVRGSLGSVRNSAYTVAYGEVPETGAIDAKEMSATALRDYLGDGWTTSGDKVVPVMQSESYYFNTQVWDPRAKVVLYIDKTVGEEVRYTERRELTEEERQAGKLTLELNTSCVDHNFRMTVEQGGSNLPLATVADAPIAKTEGGEEAIYKFDNNVVMGLAKAETEQSSVKLSWSVVRGQADYYRILRYDKMTPEKVDTLQKQYTETVYEDRTVRPQHNYIYTVEGVTQCEGVNISKASVEGCCKPTGMVRGYVRLPNGTGLPDYTVTAEPVGIEGAEPRSCVTDSTGFFEIGDLVYVRYGEYTLSVKDPSREASFTSQSVTFDDNINLQTNIHFTQSNYYIFSGFVLYEGSSIPVSDVRFLRDGKEVVNASGKPVTTDNQGAFQLSVPQGSHSIQIVKEGHVFKDDGYFIDPDSQTDPTRHNWTKDVSEVYLWDQTKVTLQGRVAGGKDQGDLPLGKSLSKNNLGDDLTLVFQLEGDNTSWIVRDQLDGSVTERHEIYTCGENDTTKVDAYRHRIVIHPDVKTGEFRLPVYPVKYKVTEVYAKGYPTLFQAGMVGETLDLNRYHEGDTATYKRIYHSEPTLDIWQFNGTNDNYYGIRQYTSFDNAGTRDTIQLWSGGRYSLGYPVFLAGASVPMVLSAREEYRYNNEQLGRLDVVQLNGGQVIVNNGLISSHHSETVDLNDNGQANYIFTPQNATYMLKDTAALRTLKMTLLYDGSYYDIKPIRAFIMAAQAKPQGRRLVAGRNTHLVDILRDPPGSSSYSFIESGSKFSYSYTADYTVTGGLDLGLDIGSGSDYYTGAWAGAAPAGGSAAGTIYSSDNYVSLTYSLTSGTYRDWQYNYTFEVKERIATSSSVREIGANSDLYIGVTDDVIVEDAIAVRAVNKKMLDLLRPGLGGKTMVNGHEYNVTGTTEVLARGWDAEKQDSVFLVRDEVMQFITKVNSTFIHSQHYITEELIPNLLRTRNDLLLDRSATAQYAQALADSQKKPVYVSKLDRIDEDFGWGENNYTVYYPEGKPRNWNDTIQALNNEISTWAGFVATNEKQKLEAAEQVKVYDFDGAANVNYSETFTTSAGLHRYIKLPTEVSLGGDGASRTRQKQKGDSKTGDNKVDYKVGGMKFAVSAKPVFEFNFNYNNGVDSSFTKTVGFVMACSRRSNLSVGVYHERAPEYDYYEELKKSGDWSGVYYSHVEENLQRIYNGRPGSSNTSSYIVHPSRVPRYRNLIFRTLGGATASPWEDEVRTQMYNPGTILDQKTMEIDQLRIWAKESSVSNVPYGEPARFTIYMTNESEFPTRVTRDLKYYLEDGTNKGGAKVYVDGYPLTVDGINLWLDPNVVIEKQVEVYAGAGYDYEDIGISLYNEEDARLDSKRVRMVTLSAHFIPAAGPVNISKPGDKWVVNTESAYDDEEHAYYLPVHIDGFDVNFRNFDHIELQYKLSTQGDKDWVNVCSYYRDDAEGRALMAQASGERKLIKSEGHIDAAFYGEKDPIEQYYDLRAVTYCRHGGGYLTRSSAVLSGIKDTRRPQLFGTPQPVDGILGIGDDIMLRFSEPLAGNYLSKVNNFEVVGQTRSSNISLSTALRFNGQDIQMGFAQSGRNLSGRSFTVDLMLNPDKDGKSKTFFCHGEGEHLLELGLTADDRLTAALSYDQSLEPTVFTAAKPCTFEGLREVFCIFEADTENGTTDISFYDGNEKVGAFTYPRLYEGNGGVAIGHSTYYNLLKSDENYSGEMLEFRLWNRALSTAEMNSYSQKQLTGSELGLLDNYPLNEGEGNYSYNRAAGGSDMFLMGHTWKIPNGIGMKLDGEKGFRMESSVFNRFDHEDYTLMFKFRTTSSDGTLLANGRATTEDGAKSHFRFNTEKGLLNLNLSGLNVNSQKGVNDGQWHHVVLSVNRSRNVGCLYLDEKLTNTFAVDTLGGIRGNLLAAGATYTDATTAEDPATGHIDEIAMYEMALPENVIKSTASSTPTGEEMGLLAYLSFSESIRQADNTMRLMPSGVSLRRYKDTTAGTLTNRRDTVVAQEVVDRLCDRMIFAPMHDKQEMENIRFSYVADGKDLLINLDVPEAIIEKTNVYIVVKEAADLQGNLMASPVMMDLYVHRNPLRWSDKHLLLTSRYGEEYRFTATVRNLSGKKRNFELQGLPSWMTASTLNASVGAQDEETVTFTVSPYTNIGNFEETIYMVGDDGMSEPLPISLKVRGEKPDWAVDDALLRANITMSMIAQVKIDGNVANDSEDMLAVFNENHRLLGVTQLTSDVTKGANDGLAFLTVYNANYAATPLSFEYFDASTGIIHLVKPVDGAVIFQSNTVKGTTTDPVVLEGERNGEKVQAIQLKKGWNWVSFNVVPIEGSTVKQLLGNATKWQAGDALEAERADGSYSLLSYKATRNPYDPNNPIYTWDCADSIVRINPAKMYRFYSNSDKVGYITGSTDYLGVTVKKGWNRIGYMANLNLPLGKALAEYAEQGSAGDIVKSQSQSAVLTVDATGNKAWRGTLEFMRVGEGYMLLRHQDSEATFYYPYYIDSRYRSESGAREVLSFDNAGATSMTMVAVAEGVDVMPGDRLTAYRGEDICGVAEADGQGVFFLNVGDAENATTRQISFTLERDGDVVAETTRSRMTYAADAALGTPDNPTVINFAAATDDSDDSDEWYTVGGIRLRERPNRRGIYIRNNEKVTVK